MRVREKEYKKGWARRGEQIKGEKGRVKERIRVERRG